MSAVSNRLTPASRASLICRRAPSTSIWPTGDAHPVPPNPIVPRVSVETRRPLRPSCRYSIRLLLSPARRRVRGGNQRHRTDDGADRGRADRAELSVQREPGDAGSDRGSEVEGGEGERRAEGGARVVERTANELRAGLPPRPKSPS